jgi:hypothetical protein
VRPSRTLSGLRLDLSLGVRGGVNGALVGCFDWLIVCLIHWVPQFWPTSCCIVAVLCVVEVVATLRRCDVATGVVGLLHGGHFIGCSTVTALLNILTVKILHHVDVDVEVL